MALGVDSVQLVGQRSDYPHLQVENGFLINPLRNDRVIDSITNFVFRYVENSNLRLPTIHDVISHLVRLNNQIMHYLNLKALVSTIRDMCFKCKYTVCERRDVPAGTVISKKNWGSSVVPEYDPSNHHHVNIKAILRESAGISFESYMERDDMNIPNISNVCFSRETFQIGSEFSGHACGDTAITPEKLQGSKVLEPVTELKSPPEKIQGKGKDCMEVELKVVPEKLQGNQKKDGEQELESDSVDLMSVDKEEKEQEEEKNVYELETEAIEKAFSLLKKSMKNKTFSFNIYSPNESMEDYIQSIFHNENEFDWEEYNDNYLETSVTDTVFFKTEGNYMKLALQQLLEEQKQKLVVAVRHDEMDAEDELAMLKDAEENPEDHPNHEYFQSQGGLHPFDRPVDQFRIRSLTEFFNRCKNFLGYLPSCVEFDLGIQCEEISISQDEISFCPLSKSMSRWRHKCGCEEVLGQKFIPCDLEQSKTHVLVRHLDAMKEKCVLHKTCLYFVMYKHKIDSVDDFCKVSSKKREIHR